MPETEYQCWVEKGHLFVMLDEGTFLVDTGSPTSFGRVPSVTVGGQHFPLAQSYMGLLSAEKLSGYVGRERTDSSGRTS